MALLEPQNTPSNEAGPQNTESYHLSLGFVKIFFASLRKIHQKLFFVVRNFGRAIKDTLLSHKFLPHFAMILILGFVTFSNLDQTAQAQAINSELISVDPADEQAVVQSADPYTPLITNDSQIAESANTVLNGSGGFAGNNAPVATNVTPRIEPLPDNSTGSVAYIVKDGDTLSGLGLKFSVKVATLKYVNNINNADSIKPHQKLTIPVKNYEVAPSLIAAKANAAAKVASAAATAAAKKTATAKAKKTYYGTINGVRYIERSYGQCYTYVESQGYAIGGHVLAKWIPTNSSVPKVGGLVVTNESWAGHVAIVIGVNDDGTFNLRERNYASGWITERTMRADDGVIKGFVN